jgi:hypothetical protein
LLIHTPEEKQYSCRESRFAGRIRDSANLDPVVQIETAKIRFQLHFLKSQLFPFSRRDYAGLIPLPGILEITAMWKVAVKISQVDSQSALMRDHILRQCCRVELAPHNRSQKAADGLQKRAHRLLWFRAM